MKRRRGLFVLSTLETDYFDDKQDKFELVACPINGSPCKNHLSIINANYKDSCIHLRNKDYPRSIEALKGAYYTTTHMNDAACRKCNELFRSAISQTLEKIRIDLYKMTTGLFSTKRFQSSYKLACNVSEEIRKVS